jgi:ATP-dependent Clp protease protease subunit
LKRWYEFRAQAKGAAEIVIYDEIGAFGIPAKAFLDELKALGPVAELTLRINSLGGSVFDGVAIYNALKRHQATVTVWIDGIAASIASMIAMAGDQVVMPENAMLVLHDPSGLVAGTAADMRATADALDKMAAAMVAAYRDKSGAGDEEIAALMAAETWLSAEEAVELGLADRVEAPVRMAAHFDLSCFRNPPPQLAAFASVTAQEDDMSDSRKTRPRKPDEGEATAAGAPATEASTEQIAAVESDRPAAGDPPIAAAAEPPRAPEGDPAATAVAQHQATPTNPAAAALPTAQVIDLDAVRADERRATLAYVAEVHELCDIAGRGDLAAGFIAKAAPVAQVRRALLEARAAEDEATAIRSQVRPASIDPAPAAIDTAAIYAARNQHCR